MRKILYRLDRNEEMNKKGQLIQLFTDDLLSYAWIETEDNKIYAVHVEDIKFEYPLSDK